MSEAEGRGLNATGREKEMRSRDRVERDEKKK